MISSAAELAQMLAPGGLVAGKIGKAAKLGALDKKTKKLREALEKLAKETPDAHNNWLKERASGGGSSDSGAKNRSFREKYKEELRKKADGHGFGDSNSVDKWSRTPKTLQDKMVLDAAKQGKGKLIIKDLNDPKYKGMEKWEYKVKSETGKDSVVHYVRDPKTGELMDFKFKKHSTD